MDSLGILRQVVTKLAPGRSPAYTETHVLKALELMDAGGSIGRQQLARELRLGEGIVRTLISRLKEKGLLTITRGGMALTVVGSRLMEDMKAYYMTFELPETHMTLGLNNYAVLVKGAGSFVDKGIEQRDAAIIAGARGATTLIAEDGKIHMPGFVEQIDSKVIELISASVHPDEGDVIIIGSDDDKFNAERGAKSAALKLMSQRAAQKIE
jgi:hypothetical protein